MVQGFLGFGQFAGGTIRLAVPSIVLGFLLGIFVGIGRLASAWWIRVPATLYVEFFRGVPARHGDLLDVAHHARSCWGPAIPEFGVALAAFVIFEAAYLGEIVRAGIQSVARGQVEAAARARASAARRRCASSSCRRRSRT